MLTKKRKRSLKTMQALNLPRATCETVGIKITIRDDCPPEEREGIEADQKKALAEVDEYLEAFTPGDKCPCCDQAIRGLGLMHAIVGGFNWGIANGEGHCSNCGHPCRAYHRSVGPFEFFEVILAYHPDTLKKREQGCPNATKST